jgi:hypothetical protein
MAYFIIIEFILFTLNIMDSNLIHRSHTMDSDLMSKLVQAEGLNS